jgi:hypothetical protein
MSTYFVLYTAHLTTGNKDKNILVDSDRSGRELYRQVQDTIAVYEDAPYIIKNIVCLGGAPGTQMHEENPLRVTHSSRPDLEITLYVSGVYNDRMDVNVRSKDTGETHSMCFELPADPRRL